MYNKIRARNFIHRKMFNNNSFDQYVLFNERKEVWIYLVII